MNGINGKTILITGATAGIGRSTALSLAGRGCRVFATGRNEKQLAELAKESGGKIETVRLDVNDLGSIKAAADQVHTKTQGHGVDVLINNAGYGQFGPLLEVTDEQLRAQFETNVFGLMAVTRAFAGKMVERRSGRIVNISSGGGKMSFPFAGAYTATKFAVEAMSDSLRMELGPLGVKVVLIEPGPIKTNFSGTAVDSIGSKDRPGSPYAKIYAKADAMQAQSDSMSFSPQTVVRAIEKAVFKPCPAARYTAPSFMKPMMWMSNFIPTGMMDFVMRRGIGLTKENMGQGK
ncbi:MAG: SDR family oxidoreductase [Bdellovibrionota bacterium]